MFHSTFIRFAYISVALEAPQWFNGFLNMGLCLRSAPSDGADSDWFVAEPGAGTLVAAISFLAGGNLLGYRRPRRGPPSRTSQYMRTASIALFRRVHSASKDSDVGYVVNFLSKKICWGSIFSSVRNISFVSSS
jgi:hypothetical protein